VDKCFGSSIGSVFDSLAPALIYRLSLDEEERGCVGAFRRSNVSLRHMFFNELQEFFLFRDGECVDFSWNGGGAFGFSSIAWSQMRGPGNLCAADSENTWRDADIPVVSFEGFGGLLPKTVWRGTILERRRLAGLSPDRARIDHLMRMWGAALISS